MTNEVIPTSVFINKAKRLRKKFHTLDESLLELEKQLLKNPRLGDSYGKNIYKIRLSDVSKGVGKSGGFRLVTYVIEETTGGTSVYLITIFDKSEESTIDKQTALKLIEKCGID